MAYKDKAHMFEHVNAYNQDNYDRVTLMLPKGEREKLKAYCAANGESMNAYLLRLIRSERHSRDWIPISRQMPPDMDAVTVTLEDSDGNRYIQDMVRFNRKMEEYNDKFKSEHPNGVWEWPYELGADYWEDVRGTVIAWIPDPEPYLGD